MNKPKLLVFASGTDKDGGTGFEKLVLASRDGRLNAEIVGVVSNHAKGGVWKRAYNLGITFWNFPEPRDASAYQFLASRSGADFFALSGWLKLVKGLDPATRFNSQTVFNIHPGPLPRFGGPGLFGHHIHEAVMEAFRCGEVTHTTVSMHFVTEQYDKGPLFFHLPVKIKSDDTPETLQKRVLQYEHFYQPLATHLVVNELITWDGFDPNSLRFPPGFTMERFLRENPFEPK